MGVVDENLGVVDENLGVVDENLGVVDRKAVGLVDEMGFVDGSLIMIISSRTPIIQYNIALIYQIPPSNNEI